MLDPKGKIGVVPRCAETHLLGISQRGLPISPFARAATGARTAQKYPRKVAQATEVGTHSRGAHDFLGKAVG